MEHSFGLALIDTLDLIEEAFIIPFEAVNGINGGTWAVQLQGGEIAFSLTDCS